MRKKKKEYKQRFFEFRATDKKPTGHTQLQMWNAMQGKGWMERKDVAKLSGRTIRNLGDSWANMIKHGYVERRCPRCSFAFA